MIDDLLKEAEQKMDQALKHVIEEFTVVRTGRANPQILHRITVDYYGQPTPLQQLSTISVPESRMLVVQPYDPGSIPEIEKAIQGSDLGINPSNDGKVVRIVFPPLTEERRAELVKVVRGMAEEGRVAVRNVRRHIRADLEAMHGDISDDDIHRGEAELQEVTDQHIAQIDSLLERKETELREV